MREMPVEEPEYDHDTEIMISGTSLNIWNKDLQKLYKDAIEALDEIDADFASRFS